MTVTPEDLVECWHLLTAGGDEPVEWEMDESLWKAVQRAAEQREPIDAGDTFTEVGDLTLLGTPVTIVANGDTPVLRYRSNGELQTTPIIGGLEEA